MIVTGPVELRDQLTGLTRGAGLIRWGERTTPLGESDAELPPCDQTALEIMSDAIKYTGK